jgi:hypothetical protein
MKSMNESFKVFSNTIKEVSTLQQRLESSYDEIGEVLGKYYEIKEGNEFGAERAKAIAGDEDSFEVDGKSYKVTGVDAEDKENAEEFANESMKLTSLLKKESVNEENKPTNPALWSRAKAAAKAKYDVYPSAYANGYASKWYKEKGGSWKTENTSPTDMEEGNEFGAERAKAIAANKDSFEVDGKTYKVTGVDAQDKENAKDFANESMKLTSMLKKSKSKK